MATEHQLKVTVATHEKTIKELRDELKAPRTPPLPSAAAPPPAHSAENERVGLRPPQVEDIWPTHNNHNPESEMPI